MTFPPIPNERLYNDNDCGQCCAVYLAALNRPPAPPPSVLAPQGISGSSDIVRWLTQLGCPDVRTFGSMTLGAVSPGDIVLVSSTPDGVIVADTPSSVGHWVVVCDASVPNMVTVANPYNHASATAPYGEIEEIPRDLLDASYRRVVVASSWTVLPQGAPPMTREQIFAFVELWYASLCFRVPSDAEVTQWTDAAVAQGVNIAFAKFLMEPEVAEKRAKLAAVAQ